MMRVSFVMNTIVSGQLSYQRSKCSVSMSVSSWLLCSDWFGESVLPVFHKGRGMIHCGDGGSKGEGRFFVV